MTKLSDMCILSAYNKKLSKEQNVQYFIFYYKNINKTVKQVTNTK